MENENQDTVALLEKCVDVDKRGMRLLEEKRCSVESIEVRKWKRYMDGVKKVGGLQTALGWRVYDRRHGRNRVTRSSVRGMTRVGISCARGGTR